MTNLSTHSTWKDVVLHYRVLEFACAVIMMGVGVVFSVIDVHDREIPNIEVQLNATTTFWARDPTINLKKMPQQVPMLELVVIGGLLPVVINLSVNYIVPKCKRTRIIPHDTRDFLLTLVQSISLAFLLTQFMKNMTGRFRPCFYDMCGWQYDVVWDGVTNLCTNAVWEKEGRKSFPSGHSSYAWSTMLPLTLYLLGRSRLNSENRSESMMRGGRRSLKLFICFIPCLVATWVAITRSIDNWHHYTDIVNVFFWDCVLAQTGSMIGAVSASLAYNYNYGSVFSWESAGIPNQEYHNRRKQKMRDMLSASSSGTSSPSSLQPYHRNESHESLKKGVSSDEHAIDMSSSSTMSRVR